MQHKSRWVTALVLIPLVLGVLWSGNSFLFGGLVSVVSILAFYEYWVIIINCNSVAKQEKVLFFPILFIAALTSITMTSASIYASVQGILLALCGNFILIAIFSLVRFPKMPMVFDFAAYQVFGVFYIFIPLCFVMVIQSFDQGSFLLLWILIATFANDTCAFYVGTTWGKHKLAPAVSPKKSIEGSLGGIGASLIFGFLFAWIFFQSFPLAVKMLPCALIIALVGQLGDLVESAMKRRAGIKDSGKILPGHGGVLDRIDGLLFTLPSAYAYWVLIIQ